jgi:hypothetical protein
LILAAAMVLLWAEGGGGLSAGALPADDIPSDATPLVQQLNPSQAAAGDEVTVVVEGRNFSSGAYVSFTTPSIHVISTRRVSETQIEVKLAVSPKAQPGAVTLYVSNPASFAAQAAFTIVTAGVPAPAAPAAPPTPPAEVHPSQSTTPEVSEPAGSAGQRFEVYNLGDVASLLQSPNKTKGTLIVRGEKLTYEESGKEVFSTPLSDIKEVDANIILGLNTGTFHINLTSGKTYNLVAGSLRPADSQSIVDSLRKAIH